MQQPNVPWWFAATILVADGMITFALATSDPNVTFLTPNVKWALGAIGVALSTLLTVLNISRSRGFPPVEATTNIPAPKPPETPIPPH